MHLGRKNLLKRASMSGRILEMTENKKKQNFLMLFKYAHRRQGDVLGQRINRNSCLPHIKQGFINNKGTGVLGPIYTGY